MLQTLFSIVLSQELSHLMYNIKQTTLSMEKLKTGPVCCNRLQQLHKYKWNIWKLSVSDGDLFISTADPFLS